MSNDIYNRVTIKKNDGPNFEKLRSFFRDLSTNNDLFFEFLPPIKGVNQSNLCEWQQIDWNTVNEPQYLKFNYDEEDAFQVSFISPWDPPIEIYLKLINDNPNLDIFISMASIDSSLAGWICKLADMKTYEEDFFYGIDFTSKDSCIFAEVVGGSRFIELASQFEHAPHSWAFIDAPSS